MIYSNLISNKSLLEAKDSDKDSIDIYIDTKCDLRKVIRFLNEHYIPKEKEEELSDWEKEQRDKERKKNDQEAKRQKKLQNSSTLSTSGAFHINIEIFTKKYDFKVHIRNKEGASHDVSQARHGATAKIVRHGTTSEDGIPVIVSTGQIIPDNVNKNVANEIERKYPIALDFIRENRAPLTTIWNTTIPNEINRSLEMIKYNLDNDAKYISYKINYT